MKKVFYELLIIFSLVFLLIISSAACIENGVKPAKTFMYKLNSDGESYSVIGMGECERTDIIIPSVYNDKPVTQIGGDAFKDSSVESVEIENGIKLINSRAFMNCKSLKKVVVPESVVEIGNQAFFNTPLLAEFVFNAERCNNQTVHNGIFYKAGNSTEGLVVKIGRNVTQIPNYMFVPENVSDDSTSPNITEIIFDADGVLENIGMHAFRNLSGITRIDIPQSVVNIGDHAFSGCENVISLEFADGSKLKQIGQNSFGNFYKVQQIIFPSGLESIGNDAFYVASSVAGSLERVYIPNTVNYVGSCAFYKNPNNSQPVKAYLEADTVPETWDSGWSNFGVEIFTGYRLGQEI